MGEGGGVYFIGATWGACGGGLCRCFWVAVAVAGGRRPIGGEEEGGPAAFVPVRAAVRVLGWV